MTQLNTGLNDKIVAIEKTTWFHFRLMKTGFLFCCRPSTTWPVVYKSQEWEEPSIMSECDTMFNERDWRCATVQLMLSTDPSYDNRTIASTLKIQIRIATNNRVMKTKFPAKVMVFGVVSSEGHIMPPHIFEVSLKVNTKVYVDVLKSVVIPWCNQVAGGRFWVWQQDSTPAHKSKETQAWLPPPDLNPLDYFVWSYVENINMPSHNTKTSLIVTIRRVFAELPVRDPYQGGEWGWRLLKWIDVSSTT